MRPVTLEESKQIQFELLKKVHKYCKDNNLSYFLIDGTLLGAIRHHGFIPWDDDIDILMPRKDYDLFFQKFGERDNAKAINCETDNDYYLPFGKVIDTRTVVKENISLKTELGVYIDVFVLDALSDNYKENERAVKKLQFYRNLLSVNLLPGSDKRKGWKRIAHSILNKVIFLFNMNNLSKKMNNTAKQLGKNTKNPPWFGRLCNISAAEIEQKLYPEDFNGAGDAFFEGSIFCAPCGYDRVLKELYNDYMQFPPENERVSHHEYNQYWKE